MRLVGVLDRNHRVTMAPYQKPGVPEAHGLSLAQCKAAARAVTLDSNRYMGAAAINLALSVALGTALPVRFYSAPGIKQLQDAVYIGSHATAAACQATRPTASNIPTNAARKLLRVPKEHRRVARRGWYYA